LKARDRARVLPESAELRERQLLAFRSALEAIAAGDPNPVGTAKAALEAGGYAMTWPMPAALNVRSPYYLVPVATLAPPEGFPFRDDAQFVAQTCWRAGDHRPLAVVQVAMHVASIDQTDLPP
jgi:hypothetical protein